MKARAINFFVPILACCAMTHGLHAELRMQPERDRPDSQGYQWIEVSGVGTHYFTTAMIHSAEPTETGLIQRSTDIVELEGDLVGRVLYHPTTELDFVAGTMVNTGNQVFSGTVLGSAPVLLHDDEFRVEVDLVNQTTFGRMYLVDHLAGEKIRCVLEIFGEGTTTPEGDAVVDYAGLCRIRAPMAGESLAPTEP